MTMGRRAFVRLAAFFGLSPAIALSVRDKPVDASVTDLAQSTVTVAGTRGSVVFYVAGWETPDTGPDGIDQIPIRIDRSWRASRPL